MALADRYGLPVSTSSSVALERYQKGMDHLLSYGPDGERSFLEATAADEGLGLAHAGVALLAFVRGDGAAAKSAIARAGELVAGATRRERQHVEALAALMGGEATRGLALVDEHVKEFPRDALVVNQASSTIGFGGRAGPRGVSPGLRRAARPRLRRRLVVPVRAGLRLSRDGPVRPLAPPVRALARAVSGQCQCEPQYRPRLFEAVDNDGGVAFLEPWLAGYDRRAPFHCHLAWHLALFELHRGHSARALEIYERDIAGGLNPRLAVMDGTALLWRFGLFDCREHPLSWRRLADLAARVSRPGFVFGDIHAALAYASCGDEEALSNVIDTLTALDAKGHAVAGTVALPLVRGAAAFAAGDYAAALAHIEPVDGEIHRMGGSHAQWEIFEETMVVCHLKLNHAAAATTLLRRRLEQRASPRDQQWLDEARSLAPQAASTPA